MNEKNKQIAVKTGKKDRTRFITQSAIIAALYAALTIFIMPLSYGVMQLRVSEALTILPVFTKAAVPGLFIGCLVSNIVSPVGAIDIVIGSAASLIAAIFTYKFREHRLIALAGPVISNAILVGGELYYFYNVDFSIIACMLWVGLGEAIACYVLGYPLGLVLDRHEKVFKLD